jgi:hypothetical protein
MSTSRSLVPVEVPSWQPARRRRSRLLSLFLLGTALTGAAVIGTAMLRPAGPRTAFDLPTIGIAPVVFAEPWVETPLPIHVTSPEIVGKGYIQIDGLPALASLSEGHATRPGSWAVPVARLVTLKITSPGTEDAQPRLAVALVSQDGIVLSVARPLLAVMRTDRLAAPPPAILPTLPPQCPARLPPPKPVEEPAAAWVWPGARQEARSLVRRGDEALARGSVGAARQTYEYAADEMRWPTAALALAATYDPHELGYLAPLVVPDAEKARGWYEEARTLADARIDFHLQRLEPPAGAPAAPLQPVAAEPAPLWVWFTAMEAKTIVRWGDDALARGSIEAARQIYEYAAAVMRWPNAALALAATYDKDELVHIAPSVTPEPKKARLWYERSRELMNARIDFHLQRLGAPKASRHALPERVASCG